MSVNSISAAAKNCLAKTSDLVEIHESDLLKKLFTFFSGDSAVESSQSYLLTITKSSLSLSLSSEDFLSRQVTCTSDSTFFENSAQLSKDAISVFLRSSRKSFASD